MSHEYIGGIESPLFDDDGTQAGFWVAMPDADIANLGKSRQAGCVWLCGDYAECILTSTTYLEGVAPVKATEKNKSLSHEEIQKRVSLRAQKEVRRVVNAARLRYMWTLTFCPGNSKYAKKYNEPVCNLLQKDYEGCRYLWKRFIRKVSKRLPGFEWLVIFERHESKKTSAIKMGTYHLHFATETFLPWKEITEMWGHGNVRFDDFSKGRKGREEAVCNPGAYMSKYVSKTFPDSEMYKKRYTCSRNISRPAKIMPETFFREPSASRQVVFRSEKTFDFWDERMSIGGVYGVVQTTYKL